jgi:lysophospholipase L1-like esterase
MDWIDSSPFSRKRKTRNLLLMLLALIAALALGEVFLRQFMPLHFVSSNENYRYDAEVGFRAKPGHSLVLKDYQQEFYVNPLGTINFQDDFKDYERLIFALGDSYTQGSGLSPDANYPFQLDLLLNVGEDGVYRKKYGVVNLGLSAFGGEQSLIALKMYIRTLGRPSIVLYLGCENDHNDDLWFKSGAAHKGIVQGNPYWGSWYYPIKWVFVDTEIGKRLKYLVSLKRAAAVRQTVQVSRQSMEGGGTKGEGYGTTVAELELDVIRRMIHTGEENGARVVLSWTHDTPSYEFLRSWAHQNSYAFADWIPHLKSVLKAFPALPMGNPHSGGHYRTWVNHLIAREYARQIKAIHPQGNGGG